MNDSEYKQLRETAWRRRLTAGEQARLEAHLAKHSETADDWELEYRLGESIRHLPGAPLSSNFTARVLRAVEQERATPTRSAAPWGLRWWLSLHRGRAVTMALVAIAATLAAYQYTRVSARTELARSVARVSSVATLPSLEVLQDFEAINRLSQVSAGVDLDLLAAAQ